MGTIEQKKKLQQKSNGLIALAIVCFVAFFGTMNAGRDNSLLSAVGLGMLCTGMVTWLGGLMTYAKSKGYSGLIGLLSLLGIVGLLILLVLPDQWKVPAPPVADPNSNYPRHHQQW